MELLSSLLSSLKTVDPETLDQEYNVVRTQLTVLKSELGLTTEAGALKENIKKNRYKDIIPYDQSRVVLSPIPNCDSDYINASFIKGATEGSSYIASQAPLSSTVTDFWRMIWQRHIKVIVMACREIEMGKRKCECYWAPLHQSAAFGPFTVYNQVESHPTNDLVVRGLTVTYEQDSHSLVQYQFLSWPDHDVPYEAAGVLNLLERVRSSQGTDTSPLLVHCSAGCGRTGVICALSYIHDLLVTKQITADFSIMKIVLMLRTQRPSAVQTKDQYRFIFTAVTFMFEHALHTSAGSLYSNLPQLKKTTPPSIPKRLSQANMSDIYTVVNKSKRAPAATRTPPPSHHYDNDPAGAPIYSAVKPKAKRSATPSSDTANHVSGEGLASLCSSEDNQLMSAERHPSTDDYEDLSSVVATGLLSPGGIGFNCRVQRPRGPRDPPAEWGRLER